MYRIARALCLAFLLMPISAIPAHAGRFTAIEENDGLVSLNDRDYTQGMRFSYAFDPITPQSGWHRAYDAIGSFTPLFDGRNSIRQIDWIVLGQNMYTPKNKRLIIPDPTDRPYAGWLYTGVGLLEEHNGRSLDYAELLVGVVGPAAFAEEVQDAYHEYLGQSGGRGWDYQLNNEPGIALSLEKKWRLHQPIAWGLGVEAIPEAGVTLGNVWTYAQSGLLLRFGQNLKADYGVPRIRPGLSGTDYFNPAAMNSWLGWNIYAGVQGRAVARNIFLDGNTFGASRDVDKKSLVGNAVVGVSLYGRSGPRVDAAYIFCTQEFDTTRGCSKYGGINLGWQF